METNSSSSLAARELRPTPAWIKKSFHERNIWERLATIELASDKCYKVQPRNPHPPPKLSPWSERLWLTSAIAPALIMQALWYHFVPATSLVHTWHPIMAFIFYHLSVVVFTLRLIARIHSHMDFYGTFDEHNRPRDYVSDKDVGRLVISVLVYSVARTGGGLILGGYDRHAPPVLGRTISWVISDQDWPLVDLLGLHLLVVSSFCSHRSLSLEIPQQAPLDEASLATAEYSRR